MIGRGCRPADVAAVLDQQAKPQMPTSQFSFGPSLASGAVAVLLQPFG
jgi:hypothetical protein